MRARGFSLLEAMVTLVVIALVATLLMQSLAYVLAVRERVLRHERDARVAALHERWFRDSVVAAAADLPGEAPAFAGDATTVRFTTLEALKSGGIAAVSWRLVEAGPGLALEYAEDGGRWRLGAADLERAAFAYLDSAGRWHAAWPVEASPREILPRALRMDATTATGERTWWAHVGAAPGLTPPIINRLDAPDAAF